MKIWTKHIKCRCTVLFIEFDQSLAGTQRIYLLGELIYFSRFVYAVTHIVWVMYCVCRKLLAASSFIHRVAAEVPFISTSCTRTKNTKHLLILK